MTDIQDLIKDLLSGNRRALAKAITIIESSRKEDFVLADKILLALKEKKTNSIRIGISGVPGVGKSTFIEAFGMYLISIGKKVAVLAVDPTSPITGGSILGDKTRMIELTASYSAFIRPSPSSGSLGGVARKTRDTILLCEKAGYDIILVETVGVGQSEVAVEKMTDFFLLLLLANAGDELQGIKKGIMEMADLILINKADGDNKIKAENARTEFENAIKLFKPKYNHWSAEVQTISSIEKTKLSLVWETIQEFVKCSGEFISQNREKQNQNWLWSSIKDQFERELVELKNSNLIINNIENKYLHDELSLRTACNEILEIYKNSDMKS